MAKVENIGTALKKEGSEEQLKICSKAVKSLTKAKCKRLLEGHDVGLNSNDKASFNKLCKTRINQGQGLLPFSNLKLKHEVDPNW